VTLTLSLTINLSLTLTLILSLVLEHVDNHCDPNHSVPGCISIFINVALAFPTWPETKTMTYTTAYVVGVAGLIMWTNHSSVGVVM